MSGTVVQGHLTTQARARTNMCQRITQGATFLFFSALMVFSSENFLGTRTVLATRINTNSADSSNELTAFPFESNSSVQSYEVSPTGQVYFAPTNPHEEPNSKSTPAKLASSSSKKFPETKVLISSFVKNAPKEHQKQLQNYFEKLYLVLQNPANKQFAPLHNFMKLVMGLSYDLEATKQLNTNEKMDIIPEWYYATNTKPQFIFKINVVDSLENAGNKKFVRASSQMNWDISATLKKTITIPLGGKKASKDNADSLKDNLETETKAIYTIEFNFIRDALYSNNPNIFQDQASETLNAFLNAALIPFGTEKEKSKQK